MYNICRNIIGYNEEDADLALSDLDIINGKKIPDNDPGKIQKK